MQIENKHIIKFYASYVIREMQPKTEKPLHPLELAKSKILTKQILVEMWCTRYSHSLLVGM